MGEILLRTNGITTDLALLIARLFIGSCFVIHGLGKLGIVGSGNLQGFAGWLKSLGVPFPELQARLAMAAEILGGALMALGFMARFGFLLCFFTMVIAAGVGHKGAGYLITNNPPGNEYALNLAMICVVLFLLGPGAFSMDAFLFHL